MQIARPDQSGDLAAHSDQFFDQLLESGGGRGDAGCGHTPRVVFGDMMIAVNAEHAPVSAGDVACAACLLAAEADVFVESDRQFSIFVHGKNEQGALLEDVASQQKSFVSVLVAIAIDKALIEVEKPVSAYIGAGWSKATPEQEAKIRVIDLLTMSSGLNDNFGYEAPAGTAFYCNTPVYAVTKRVVAAAANQPLDTITRDWLTVPTGMKETAWRKRPAALASVGNDTGLVSTPRDIAAFGLMVLHGGISNGGAGRAQGGPADRDGSRRHDRCSRCARSPSVCRAQSQAGGGANRRDCARQGFRRAIVDALDEGDRPRLAEHTARVKRPAR
jgi:hypothetical protein